MRPLSIKDAATVLVALQGEIHRNPESRYNHRLHSLALVAKGMSALEVAQLFGDAPRSVQNWVRRFEQDGLAGLLEGERPGRPRRLNEQQLQAVNAALRRSPAEFGLGRHLWDGKTLSAWIEQSFGVQLRVRQCQYLFRDFGFRLRKPRPVIARADPERQRAHKKNSRR